MKIAEFTVNGRPVPFKRHSGQGRRARNDARYTAWRDLIAVRALEAYHGAVQFGGDILTLQRFRAEDWNVGDADNYGKGPHDALQKGVLYEDDKQVGLMIVDVEVDKERPGVDILVCDLTPELRRDIFDAVHETIKKHMEVE